jgi:hypothetical protein
MACLQGLEWELELGLGPGHLLDVEMIPYNLWIFEGWLTSPSSNIFWPHNLHSQ